MAREVKRSEEATLDAWRTLKWVAEQYQRLTGEEHTYTPITTGDSKYRGLWDIKILKERSTQIMVSINQILKSRPQTDPFPSSPQRPPVINITLKLDDGRIRNFGFAALWAARRFVDFVSIDAKTSWMTDNALRINDRYTITTDVLPAGLSELLEQEFTDQPRDWFLPTSMMSEIARFTGDHRPAPAREPAPAKPRRAKQAEPGEPAPKTKQPSGDFTALPDICSPLGIDPKEARNILRKTNTPKPTSGRWEWPASQVEAITKLLKDNRK